MEHPKHIARIQSKMFLKPSVKVFSGWSSEPKNAKKTRKRAAAPTPMRIYFSILFFKLVHPLQLFLLIITTGRVSVQPAGVFPMLSAVRGCSAFRPAMLHGFSEVYRGSQRVFCFIKGFPYRGRIISRLPERLHRGIPQRLQTAV